jgi:hypothetical protein
MHVLPRALMLELRATGKSLFEGHHDRPGVSFSQNGAWDDRVVCETHERAFALSDDYATDLCRRLETEEARVSDNTLTIGNPRPDLLVRFIYATVWRRVSSADGKRINLSLGPFGGEIEDHLFGDCSASLPAIVGRANLRSADGKRAMVAIPPYRQKMADWNVWHFHLGGLDFYLKTDRRPFPSGFSPYLANDNDPLTLVQIDPLRVDQVPILEPVFSQMYSIPLRPKVRR